MSLCFTVMDSTVFIEVLEQRDIVIRGYRGNISLSLFYV